jgi:hypothetical protein
MSSSDSHLNLCSELVTVLYEDRSRQTRQTVGNLEEISTESAVLCLEESVQRGRAISFHVKNHDVYGIVDSCVADPQLGYFITVALDKSSHWSEKWFTPEHLLSLWKTAEEGDRTVRGDAA